MDYLLTEDQIMIRDLARQIAVEKIVPVRAELDEQNKFPTDIMKAMAQADLFGIYIPEEYGGLGKKSLDLYIAIEEISKACVGVSTSYAANALGTYPILLHGSDAQKKKYLPDIASGKNLAAFGLTEANAGSDASGVQTTAKLDGNEYVAERHEAMDHERRRGGDIHRHRHHGQVKGRPRRLCFIVEKGTPGFTFGKKENKMGIRASSTTELIFNNCRIPKENLIAKEGLGFIVAMKTLDCSRAGVGAQGVGVAQGAIDEASSSPRAGSSSASPSPHSRPFSTCLRTCRPRPRRPAPWSIPWPA